jgi:hypothetical protein
MTQAYDQLIDIVNRPEDRLLLCCARTVIGSDTADWIRTLLREPIDWDYLIGAASAHGVKPLLCYVLSKSCPESIPRNILDQHNRYLHAHTLKNLFLAHELIRLLGALEKIGVTAIPWKGPVLAATAYGDVGLRQFCDLDILVREQDALRAKDLLLSAGYRLQSQESAESKRPVGNSILSSFTKKCDLQREDGRVMVELHWAITSHTFYFPLDPNSLWQRVGTVSIEGSPVPNLSPEDLLLVLSVHGSKHHWGRLLWICDIAELLRTYSEEIDWKRLTKQASSLGTERILYLALFLAHDVLGAIVPEDVWQRTQTAPKVASLAAQVRSQLFSGAPVLAVERPSFYIQLRERATDRLRCRLYLGYRMLTPQTQAWTLRLLHGGRSVLQYFQRA